MRAQPEPAHHRCNGLVNIAVGALWSSHGAPARGRPARGTPEEVYKVCISREATTDDVRDVLAALLLRYNARYGFVLAQGPDREQPWKGLAALRTSRVTREWIEECGTRSLVLCPVDMVDSHAEHTPGRMRRFLEQRAKWEAEVGQPSRRFVEVKRWCVPHQHSGVLTPILRDRAAVEGFLSAVTRLFNSSGATEFEVLLAAAWLGDIQRHPFLRAEDMSDRDGAMRQADRVLNTHLHVHQRKECFGNRGTSRLFPVQTTEALSHLLAMWNAAAVDDFPFIGIPLANHTGRVGAWPFTPHQAHILVILAQLFTDHPVRRRGEDEPRRGSLDYIALPGRGPRESDAEEATPAPPADYEPLGPAIAETEKQSPGGDQA